MAKTKVSVTIDELVLHHVDQLAKKGSRSEIFELALKQWVGDKRRKALEEEIETYYAEMEGFEREEDLDWAALSAESLGKTWR